MKSIVIIVGYLFLNHEGRTIYTGITRTAIIELFQIGRGNRLHQRQVAHQWYLQQHHHSSSEWKNRSHFD